MKKELGIAVQLHEHVFLVRVAPAICTLCRTFLYHFDELICFCPLTVLHLFLLNNLLRI